MPSKAPTKPHFLTRFRVENLWKIRNVDLKFDSSVNILIGPNGSGKTTILNLLQNILHVDVKALREIEFTAASLSLGAFEDESKLVLRITPVESGYNYRIGDEDIQITDQSDQLGLFARLRSPRTRLSTQARELQGRLRELVPAVWLSVSRRLPVPDEEEIRVQYATSEQQLESVDHRLKYLVEQLSKYRVRLDAQLSGKYKEFERKVLQEMLYSKEYDKIDAFSMALPSAEERQRLVLAFRAVGLMDSKVEKRIEEHFTAAEEAISRLEGGRGKGGDVTIKFEDLLVLPLIRRTNALVQYARELDRQREEIFEPLNRFITNVNRFFERKRMIILEDGLVVILSTSKPPRSFTPDQLSSGEKQLLILLIEALLREDRPVIYFADEPELSLHVRWQSQLLPALIEVGGRIQLIVATHSPDIVGNFTDSVIELSPM